MVKKPVKKAAKAARKSKRSPDPDVNQLAHYQVQRSTEEKRPVEVQPPTRSEISRVMAELGRRGGKVGGKRRAEMMTPERRREIALQAARSRWDAAEQGKH